MADPITSQYDPHPFDPNAQDNSNAPPPDLGNTDSPDVKVAWDTRPSFNKDPQDINEPTPPGGPPPQQSSGDAQDFKVRYEEIGTQVSSMLERARGLVNQYEDLRSKVLPAEGSIFGQNSVIPGGDVNVYDSGSHTWTSHHQDTAPTAFAKPAQDFAGHMNPAQQKALQAVGSALETIGEYIALVNHSGQVYAAADRKSKFPGPPPKIYKR